MSSFAGVSVIIEGKNCTTSAIDVHTDSGHHLLVVKDYSLTVEEKPNGDGIISAPFMVGGHKWCILHCPNGEVPSSADFISFYIGLCDDGEGKEAVEAKFCFSFVNEVEYQKPMYIRAKETSRFSNKGHLIGDIQFMRRDAFERSVHLNDDCFTIWCEIMVCKDRNTGDAIGTLSDIHRRFDHLRQNKVGADVTFEVNFPRKKKHLRSTARFAAHRCVLAARSKVFMAQLFGPMTESTMSSVIEIKDIEAKVFEALLSFIYTDSVPQMGKDNSMEEVGGKEEDEAVEVEEGQEDEAAAVAWVTGLQDLFVAADRYDIQQLKFSCENKLSKHIRVSSLASMLALAEQHHSHGLKEACLRFIQIQSPKCLDKVMETDGWDHLTTTYPSVLKEIIAKLASNQNNDKRKR